MLEHTHAQVDYPTKLSKMQNVSDITLFVPSNFGADSTVITYLGFKGESTKASGTTAAVSWPQKNLCETENHAPPPPPPVPAPPTWQYVSVNRAENRFFCLHGCMVNRLVSLGMERFLVYPVFWEFNNVGRLLLSLLGCRFATDGVGGPFGSAISVVQYLAICQR